MSDAPEPTTTTTTTFDPTESAARSTRAVAGILGALLLLLLAGACLAGLLASDRSDGGGAADVMAGVRDNRIQAVQLSDGQVFFGDLRELGGDVLELRDAYFLRQAASGTKAADAATPSLDVVSVRQQVTGGDGDLVVDVDEIVTVQDLAASSQVARTIEDAR